MPFRRNGRYILYQRLVLFFFCPFVDRRAGPITRPYRHSRRSACHCEETGGLSKPPVARSNPHEHAGRQYPGAERWVPDFCRCPRHEPPEFEARETPAVPMTSTLRSQPDPLCHSDEMAVKFYLRDRSALSWTDSPVLSRGLIDIAVAHLVIARKRAVYANRPLHEAIPLSTRADVSVGQGRSASG